MEQHDFLPAERIWSIGQYELAKYCAGCLVRRSESLPVQCAAEALDKEFPSTALARLSCAGIVRVGGRMPEHGRRVV